MTIPDCQHCGARFSHHPPKSETKVWKCGTWRHDGKHVGDQSTHCRIHQLEAAVKRLLQWRRVAFDLYRRIAPDDRDVIARAAIRRFSCKVEKMIAAEQAEAEGTPK